MPDSISVASLDKATLVAPLLNGEKLYSPAALAKASNVPGHRGGSHLNSSSIFRFIVKGRRGKNGEWIRLEAVRVGSRWLTSLEALGRFVAKLTADALPSGDPVADQPAPETSRQHNRAAKAA